MAKKFKCPCGYEDDNEANFNYHQQWCERKPSRVRPDRHTFTLGDFPESPEQSKPEPEQLKPKRYNPFSSFEPTKANMVGVIIITITIILYLAMLFWE